MDPESKSVMKRRFYEKLNDILPSRNSVLLSAEKMEALIGEVKQTKANETKKTPRSYWLLQHYDVVTCTGQEKLVYPVQEATKVIQYYCATENLFDILDKAHSDIGHGGRDRMITEVKSKYKNITRGLIELFLDLCEPCQGKKRGPKKGLVVKPILSKNMGSRCQIDLIDFQSQPDGEFKFIFVYQDHLTKFVVLRALKSKRAEEVASELLDIFLLFGACSLLHCDNGREFRNRIVEELKVRFFYRFFHSFLPFFIFLFFSIFYLSS